MGYLKFLGWTGAAVVVIALSAKFTGIHIALFVIIGSTIGSLWRWAPRPYFIGYVTWLVVLSLWFVAMHRLFHGYTNPQTHSAKAIQTAIGFWGLAGAIVLHPVCYGMGNFVSRHWKKTAVPA